MVLSKIVILSKQVLHRIHICPSVPQTQELLLKSENLL